MKRIAGGLVVLLVLSLVLAGGLSGVLFADGTPLFAQARHPGISDPVTPSRIVFTAWAHFSQSAAEGGMHAADPAQMVQDSLERRKVHVPDTLWLLSLLNLATVAFLLWRRLCFVPQASEYAESVLSRSIGGNSPPAGA